MNTNTSPTARFDGIRNLSPDEMAIQRDARLEHLLKMLAERRMSGPEVAEALGVSRPTAHEYLRRLESTYEAKRAVERDASGRQLWMLTTEKEFSSPATIVPARQVGMWRDALVAALFGPASALLACQHTD
jgi:predicted HTH transcriptional regulator